MRQFYPGHRTELLETCSATRNIGNTYIFVGTVRGSEIIGDFLSIRVA